MQCTNADDLSKERSHLIERYAPYANILAAKMYANRQIPEIEFEEFKQYAMVGLLESAHRFDPDNGASFKTYAAHRIKGAILSGIEKYNEKQQQITARARIKSERLSSLREQSNTSSSETDTFFQLVEVALGLAIGFMLEDSGMYQSDDTLQSETPYKSSNIKELAKVMKKLVDTLPANEQKVIRYHYFQNFRFEQIAELMQLTKGRVSQIHQSALKRLQQYYDELYVHRNEY